MPELNDASFGVLLVTNLDPEPVRITIESLVQKFRDNAGRTGRYFLEVHVVAMERSVEGRFAELTPNLRRTCDLVIWTASCAPVGEAMRDMLERAQGREPGTMSSGVITLLPDQVDGRSQYKSDLHLWVLD